MPVITLANLKDHLGITGTTHDTTLTNAVNAVNDSVVQHCGRTFDDAGSATPRTYYVQFSDLAHVDDFHTTTGLVVATDVDDDGVFETTWAAGDYQLEPLNQLRNGVTVPFTRIRAVESRFFPCGRRPSLQVTARWGWATVPAPVKNAALVWAARTFHRKDSPQGVAGFDEFGAVRLTATDVDIWGPLRPFRRLVVG